MKHNNRPCTSFSKTFEDIESVVMGRKFLTSVLDPDLRRRIILPSLITSQNISRVTLSLNKSDNIGETTRHTFFKTVTDILFSDFFCLERRY